MKAGTALLALSLSGITGCGAAPNTACVLSPVLVLEPTPSTASSSAKPPGNRVQFSSSFAFTSSPGNCPVPQIAQQAFPTWTNPDTVHISISSAADSTNGTAVCKGATAGPVTLTGTASYTSTPPPLLTSAVQLTCN